MRNRMDWRNDVYRDPEFAAFDFKVFNGEDLDELEAYRVRRDSEATIIGMEWEYLQFRDGNLSYLPLDQWKRFMNEPGYRSNDWEPNKYLLSEDFIAFVETEILAD